MALFALCFYAATQLLFRYSTLGLSFPVFAEIDALNACESIACASAIGAIAMKPHRFKSWQVALAVAALAILLFSSIRTWDFRLFYGYLLIVSLAGINMEKVCCAYSVSVLVVLIIVMALSVSGVLCNWDAIPNSRIVFSYGLGHPNTTGAFLFSSLGAMAYACWNKKTWVIPLGLSLCVAIFAFFVLSSRASAVCMASLAIAMVVFKIPAINRFTIVHGKAMCIVVIVLSLALMIWMLIGAVCYSPDGSIFTWFDKLIHGRLYYAHQYYVVRGGFSYVGDASMLVDNYHTGLPFTLVDCGYCYLALVYGLASIYALVVTFVVAIMMMFKSGAVHPMAITLLTINSFYLVVECYPIYLASCVTVLLLTYAFIEVEESSNACPGKIDNPWPRSTQLP